MRKRVAFFLQIAGVLLLAGSIAAIYVPAGGIVLAAGAILFGLALENGDN